MNILETRQRQVRQDLAAQASSTNYKNLACLSQEFPDLFVP